MRLTDPAGTDSDWLVVKPDEMLKGGDKRAVFPVKDAGQASIGQISADLHRDEKRWRVLIVLAPSEPDDASLPAAVAGKWRIAVSRKPGTAPLTKPIRCWIQRDTAPDPFASGGRQSYFDDPENRLYGDDGAPTQDDAEDAFVRRFGSANGLSTGETALMVAGFRPTREPGAQWAYAPSDYSSAGPFGFDGCPTESVACSSLSDRSRFLTGTIAAGTRSGSLSRVEGTSTAAPTVARQLAETFVTATADRVAAAAVDNYRCLLTGMAVPEDDGKLRARLGAVAVLPTKSPNADPTAE